MTSLHRRWSARVHVPTFGPTSSVADCMNWHGNQRRAEESHVTFQHEPEIIATSRINGDLYARPVTPYNVKKRSNTPIPSTEKAWTFSTEVDNPPVCNTPGQYIHIPSPPPAIDGVYTNQYHTLTTSRDTPSRLYGRYETENTFDPYKEAKDVYDNQTRMHYNPDKEEMLRDHLVREQIQSYERQIDFEQSQLRDEQHKHHYSDHTRRAMTPKCLNERSMTPNYLNDRAVVAAVREVSRRHPTQVHFDDPSRRYAAKPPLPRPPKNRCTYPKTAYPRHVENRYDGNLQVSRPTSAMASKHYTDYQRDPALLSGALTTKRVNFQTPRPGSAASMRDLRKSDHFFQWRDSAHTHPHPPTNDQSWKMSRFTRSAKPRINTRWDSDPYLDSSYARLDDDVGNRKVKVNVECEEGNSMDLNLSVARPNDTAFIVL